MFLKLAEIHIQILLQQSEANARGERLSRLAAAARAQQQAQEQALLYSKLRRTNKECQGCGAPLGLAKLCSYCGTAA